MSTLAIHNPATGGDWECPVDYLPVATQTGWVLAKRRDDSLDNLFDPGVIPSAAPVAEQTGFDPAEHDVDGVQSQVERVDEPGGSEEV